MVAPPQVTPPALFHRLYSCLYERDELRRAFSRRF